MVISQDNRIGKLHTALGGDELALLRFNGMDAVNACFEYQVEAQAKEKAVNLDDLIGTHMTVELGDRNLDPIYYDGVVTEAAWADEGDTGFTYRFTLRPWFYLLSYRVNRLIFQEMTFEDIFNQVCQEFPGDESCPVRWDAAPGDTQEYIVQYGESDMHFLMRLAQRYGFNFHFEHDQGEHTLVVSDAPDSFGDVPGDGGVRKYIDSDGDSNHPFEHFWDFTPGRRLTTGKVATTDYNFKTPTASMTGEIESTTNYANSKIERYVYPGIHLDGADGQRVAQRRQEQMSAQDAYFTAVGNTISLSSGMQVSLEAPTHPMGIDGERMICTKALHSYTEPGYRSGAVGEEQAFVGSYEFAFASVPYLPEETAFESKMPGPQTALVVGPGGDEIHCDEYGRIKVQFYWDRHGQKDENSSMYVRVAQAWAGAGWGGLFIPRIGMEVIIDFLEGDMNKPICVGCVYNADNMPPYELPGDKNWNGIKSNSTIGGGGYNEIVFNDTKGDELFRQHAQYDMETLVLNDERRTVKNDRTTTIEHDETRTVFNDETHTIKNNSTYTVKGNRDRVIEGQHTHKVQSGETRNIQQGQSNTISGGRTTSVTGSDASSSTQDMTFESNTKIELKVGGSTITMDQTSIKLSAMSIDVAASADLKTSAGMTADHKAGAMMTIKAMTVKIN